MTRYLLFISYDGTSYHGWQIQPNGNSVQAELQRALSLFSTRSAHGGSFRLERRAAPMPTNHIQAQQDTAP